MLKGKMLTQGIQQLLIAVFLVLHVNIGLAGTLIGTLPLMDGYPPPVTVADTFFSPSRYIYLHSEYQGIYERPWLPNIGGYDYLTHDCSNIDFHVIGKCFVNDVEIPPIQVFYGTNVLGECALYYSWKDVFVDLGQPGSFTIRLLLDNSERTGLVANHGWEIYSASEPVSTAIVTWGSIKARFR